MFKHYKKIILVLALLPLLTNIVIAKTLVDPTRPPGAAIMNHSISANSGKQHSPWRLSSTLIARERKRATINGELVSQGDRVNGATLIDIQAWNVTLRKNNKTFKIYLFNKNLIKKVTR